MKRALIIATIVCGAGGVAAGAPSIQLSGAVDLQDSAGHVEVLEDPAGELTFDEIMKGGVAGWRLETDTNPNHGFRSSVYWERLQLDNPTGDDATRMMVFRYPLLDRVELFAEQGHGGYAHQVNGDRLRYSERPFPSHLILFQVVVPAHSTRQLLFRVASTSSMQLGMDVMTPPREQSFESDLLFWHGSYYGLMLALAVYNLFLFLAIRNRAYLYYVVYAFVFTMTQMGLDGMAGRFLLPEHPDAANTFTPLTISMLLTPPLLFAQAFLDTRRHLPRAHRVVTGMIVLFLIPPLLALFGPYAVAIRVGAGLATVVCVMCLVLGFLVFRKGYRPARFYILGWTSVIIGTLMYVLMSFGLLPANVFFTNVQRLGSVIEILLLSFALGDHIAMLDRERDAAREEQIKLERDLAVTGAVQRLFLPKQDAFGSSALSLHGFYAPAAQCGGDWWWYEALPDGRIQVLLGDVTGHGVGAAMVTAAVAAAHRALPESVRHGDMRDVVDALNESLTDICRGAHHMTLAALEVDVARGTARFWSAGAPAPLILRKDGTVETLVAPGRPLGAPQLVIGEARVAIAPGDRLFVFSDGLPELAVAGERQLGYRGVTRLLRDTAGRPLVEARTRLIDGITAARAGQPQLDDIAFVVIDLDPRAEVRAPQVELAPGRPAVSVSPISSALEEV